MFTASPGFLGYTPTGTTQADRVPLAAGTFLPDGHTLLAVGTDGIARELDPATGHITGRFPPPALTPVNARMDLARDGRTLAVVSWEGPEAGGGRATLAVYDTATRRRRLPDTRLPLDVGAVAVSPTGRYVAVSGYSDGRVLIFDTQGRARLPVLLNVYQDAPGVRRLGPFGAAPDTDAARTVRHTAALTFRPDGQLLAGSTTGVVRLVDPATGRLVRRFTGAPGSDQQQHLHQHPRRPGAALHRHRRRRPLGPAHRPAAVVRLDRPGPVRHRRRGRRPGAVRRPVRPGRVPRPAHRLTDHRPLRHAARPGVRPRRDPRTGEPWSSSPTPSRSSPAGGSTAPARSPGCWPPPATPPATTPPAGSCSRQDRTTPS